MKHLALIMMVALAPIACTKSKTTKRPVKKIIPLTVANMKGHKLLYKEGWYVVTSTERALDFAYTHSVISSRQAILQAAADIVAQGKTYGKAMKGNVKLSYDQAVALLKTARATSAAIFSQTHIVGSSLARWSQKGFKAAWAAFITGNLSLGERTAADRGEMAALPGNFYKNLKEDFSNVYDLTSFAQEVISAQINLSWSASFKEAKDAFNLSYRKSGKRANSLVALLDIIAGYGKALFYGVVKPAGKTVAKGTLTVANYGIFLPTAASTMLAGRVVQTTGLTVYYTTKMGVKLVTPTLEGGLLTGLSLLSAAHIPIVYAGGATIGVVNQLALSALAPVYGTTRAVVTTAGTTVGHAAMVVYHVGKGTTKIVLHQLASGVVLGYNALTAIPAHLYLASVDSAIFLAWDGPRLVIAAATGSIGAGAKKHSVGDLPVGSVVDLKKLRAQKGVTVRIISRDPKHIRAVLSRAPKDMRRKKASPTPAAPKAPKEDPK